MVFRYLESYAALFFDTILATSKKLLPWLPAIPSSPWNGDETRQNPVDDNPGNETSGDVRVASSGLNDSSHFRFISTTTSRLTCLT